MLHFFASKKGIFLSVVGLAGLVVSLSYILLFFYPMKYDAANCFFPLHYYLSACLKAGVLPLWNPFMDLGLPYHADMQTGVHYFPAWLISGLLPYTMLTYHVEFLLHLVIGGLGMFYFLKHFRLDFQVVLYFALFYALSGHFLSNAQHQSWIVSSAYLPWIWAFLLRLLKTPKVFYALGLGLSSNLMLTGGYPAFLILNGYAIGIYLLFCFPKSQYKSILTMLSLAFGVFLFCSVGYFYSVWDVWDALSRAEGMSYERANMNPYSPQSLIGLFIPQLLVRQQDWFATESSMTNIYQGILCTGLLLMLWKLRFQRSTRLFAGLALLFLLLAFGDYFILRRLTFQLPFMDMFRHIGIFRIFAILFAYPLLALLFQQLKEKPEARFFLKKVFVLLSILFAIYALSGLIMGKTFLAWHLVIGSVALQLIFLLLLAGVLSKWNSKYSMSFLLGLNLLNLIVLHQFNIPTNVVHKRPLSEFNAVINQYPSGFQVGEVQKRPIAQLHHYGNEQSLPIYYNFSMIEKRFAHNQYYPFILKSKVALEEYAQYWKVIDGPILFAPEDSSLVIDFVRYHPNHFQFTVESDKDQKAYLRFVQNNFKHWKAYLNGTAVNYDRTAALIELKDLPLRQGKNQLELRYQPKWVIYTLIIGLLSSFLVFIFLFWRYFSNNR